MTTMFVRDWVAEEYLELVEGWTDPYHAPVVTEHDGVLVVRDDLLGVGSKVRMLDYLIGHSPAHAHITEWVFGGCPATGYAQVSLPVVCARYGKTCSLFMAKRSMDKLTPLQRKGLALGARYHWIRDGMLNVTLAAARAYAAQSPTRKWLPLGLEHETGIASLIKVARGLQLTPTEVWSVGSSGTLNRALQLAWPDVPAHVVSVGHKLTADQRGRATLHESPYRFDRPVRGDDVPPFPSVATYDAKAWSFVRALAQPGALFWNVAADVD